MALVARLWWCLRSLYGSAFMGMMRLNKLDRIWQEVLEADLEMIKKRGHAQAGEKTMVDVWHPVVKASNKVQT